MQWQSINHDKTSYMIMGTRQKLSRSDDCTLYLWPDQHHIKRSTSECLLGIHIDPSLSWEIQIEELRKKLLKRIGVLQRLKKYLPLKYRLMLFNASIKPVMEYVYLSGETVVLGFLMIFLNCKNVALD